MTLLKLWWLGVKQLSISYCKTWTLCLVMKYSFWFSMNKCQEWVFKMSIIIWKYCSCDRGYSANIVEYCTLAFGYIVHDMVNNKKALSLHQWYSILHLNHCYVYSIYTQSEKVYQNRTGVQGGFPRELLFPPVLSQFVTILLEYMYLESYVKQLKHSWSSIPPISTKRTIISHLNWTQWTQKDHGMGRWKSRSYLWTGIPMLRGTINRSVSPETGITLNHSSMLFFKSI